MPLFGLFTRPSKFGKKGDNQTDKTWGDKQADNYVRGLHQAIEKAAINKYLWRKVEHEDVKGIFFVRYERHYIFFRELSKDVLGVVNVTKR